MAKIFFDLLLMKNLEVLRQADGTKDLHKQLRQRELAVKQLSEKHKLEKMKMKK
jgi:hypothetical protein